MLCIRTHLLDSIIGILTGWDARIEALQTLNLVVSKWLGVSSNGNEGSFSSSDVAEALIELGLLDVLIRLLRDVQER